MGLSELCIMVDQGFWVKQGAGAVPPQGNWDLNNSADHSAMARQILATCPEGHRLELESV